MREAGDAIDEGSDLAKLLRDVTRTTLHATPSLQEAAQIVVSRRYRAVSLIRKLSWAELGIAEPELSREEKAAIGGLTIEELDKAWPEEKPEEGEGAENVAEGDEQPAKEAEQAAPEESAFADGDEERKSVNSVASAAAEDAAKPPKSAAGTLKCN